MANRRIEEAMRLQFEREKWGIAREAYRQTIERIFGMTPEERVKKLALELQEFEKSTWDGSMYSIYRGIGVKGTSGASMAGWTLPQKLNQLENHKSSA